MGSRKFNFERVLAKMALLEKVAEDDISDGFLESVPTGEIESCFVYLRGECQSHFEMLSDSVENLVKASRGKIIEKIHRTGS